MEEKRISYALINRETLRMASLVSVPESEGLHWYYEPSQNTMVRLPDDFEYDISHDYDDYIYDPDTGTVFIDPDRLEPNALEYTDLATGEIKHITSEEFDSMVDEKVRNNVLAILQELADADNATIQQILNPQPKEVTP